MFKLKRKKKVRSRRYELRRELFFFFRRELLLFNHMLSFSRVLSARLLFVIPPHTLSDVQIGAQILSDEHIDESFVCWLYVTPRMAVTKGSRNPESNGCSLPFVADQGFLEGA